MKKLNIYYKRHKFIKFHFAVLCDELVIFSISFNKFYHYFGIIILNKKIISYANYNAYKKEVNKFKREFEIDVI
jgi:hypothetical protein